MKYYVEIFSSIELTEEWEDERCPSMGFCFIERNVEECVISNDGRLYATYESFHVGDTDIFTYTYIMEDGSIQTVNLYSGEYGKRPYSLESISESIAESEYFRRMAE